MKISRFAILALVSLDQASAFVQNTCPATSLAPASHATICYASTIDSGNVGGSSPTRFPYDDDAIRFAYDEWRLIYGKGDFDRYRFENFKTNYKTLTMANIQARDKAFQQGQPAPQWMSLNEYGDYSVAEYEAMLEGRLAGEENPPPPATQQAPFPVPSSVNGMNGSGDASYSLDYTNGVNGGEEQQDQFGRPIRSTQVVQQQQSRGTQVVSGGSGGAPRGTQVIQSADGQNLMQQAQQSPAYDPSMSYNGYGGEEYQDQFGRTIRSTQVVQSSDPTTQQSSWPTGTQVIQSSSPRGTQVVSSSNGAAGGVRGTQVIQKNDSASPRGTQVISSVDGGEYFSFYNDGTQVVQSSTGSSGTRVIRSDGPSAGASYGTQVIKRSDSKGTQVIKRTGNDNSGRGTLVISKDDPETWSKYSNDLPVGEDNQQPVAKRGTMVIKKQIPEPEPFPNIFDIFGSGSDEQKRETVVIDKKPAKNTEDSSKSDGGVFDFFGGSKSSDNTVAGTQLIPKKEETTDEAEKGSIFSLFSGKQKEDDQSSRSVRGTIILPKNGKTKPKQGAEKRRKTVLVPKKPEENGLPSILSFFGGAKKVTEEEAARNPNARPTLLIKKPKKKSWSLFSNDEKRGDVSSTADKTQKPRSTKLNDKIEAQLAKQRQAIENATKKKAELLKEREAKRKELQEKRRQATERRVARAQGKLGQAEQKRPMITALGQSLKPRPNVSPKKKTMPAVRPPLKKPQLSFFGNSQPPEVRRWKQNSDGSITGYIYNSKSFEDGTRVTTSPVPRGAKRGTVITTSGGTKYSLL